VTIAGLKCGVEWEIPVPTMVPSIAYAVAIKTRTCFSSLNRDGDVPLRNGHGLGLYWRAGTLPVACHPPPPKVTNFSNHLPMSRQRWEEIPLAIIPSSCRIAAGGAAVLLF